MSRLLKYQMDHLRTRIHDIMHRKIGKVQQEANRAVDKIPKPEYYTPHEAFNTLVRRIQNGEVPRNPIKKSEKAGAMTRPNPRGKNAWGYTQSSPVTFMLDVMKLSGYDKRNEKLRKEYEKDRARTEKPYLKLIKRIQADADKVIDQIVLAGADGFEEAMAAFEDKEY